MSENTPEEIIKNIEPPEVKLTVPQLSDISETTEITETDEITETPDEATKTWLVVAKNRRVLRDWEALMQRSPENSSRCYHNLCTAPTTRQPGRVFPLKGKKYKGVWEYEVSDTPTLLFFVSVGFWRITPSKNSFVVLQLFPTTAVLSQARVPPDLNY